jgi:hypothetical protein
MFVRKHLLLLVIYGFSLNLFAQEDSVKQKRFFLNGYIKDLQSVYIGDGIHSLTSANLIHNRLNFKFNISSKLTGRLEVRNRIFYGDQIKQFPDFGKNINQYNGFFNLSKLWINETPLVVHSVIDRAVIEYTTDKWDIKIGRQRINWGIHNIWNPNDIFNAYNVLDFDYEERTGNDALRIQRFFKDNTSLEFAIKPGRKTDEAISALMYKFNKKNYDFQLISGVYRSDIVLGGGWAGNIKDAGFKGEISYFHPKRNSLDTSGTLSFALMSDRTFKNNWYGSFAFLYNSKPGDILLGGGSLYSTTLSAKSLFPFKYSFHIATLKTLSPITSLNFSVIYSPENHTTIFFPAFAWNVATNFDLDFTAQAFAAKQARTYKSIGSSVYVRGRWSF